MDQDQDNRLKEAFQKSLHLPANCDFEQLAFARTEGWDSIAHMKLISAIEEAYGISIDTQDVLALSTFPIAKEIVQKYAGKMT